MPLQSGNRMRILLISPGTFDDIDSRTIREIPYLFAKAFFAPHAVAAVAALTPKEHEVNIHDEYMHGPVDTLIKNNDFDIIGVNIVTNQLNRCLHIAALCKKHQPSAVVVAGGIGVEYLINNRQADIDVVFHGEAEETWPRFLEEYKNGTHKEVYKNISKPDMTKTPVPRWELIEKEITSYNAVSVQTTRGCPFDCSFCDVIYTYGRKLRSKTVDQVLEEIQKLADMQVPMIFIADDNFSGNKKYTKELLRRLVSFNNGLETPLGFLTQLDITIANDDELLELLADCNFFAVMIGVESVNEDSLKDMNKRQNIPVNIQNAVQKIQSYGIIVLAHMIIGADSDDSTVFEKTADFIHNANIVHHFCHPLTAPPGTKLWYKLKRDGRILSPTIDRINEKLDIISNIVPKKMTRIELFEGLADYWEDIYKPQKFMERALLFINGITRKPEVKTPGIANLWRLRKMLFRVITFFMFNAGKEHRKAFFTLLRTAGQKAAYLVPKVIYLYTCYLMDQKRALHDAEIAREHAEWEKANPDKLTIDSRSTPIPEMIRQEASPLFNTAYERVREKVSNRETLYKTVITAMKDYCDRFGESFEGFDEYQRENIINSCDRIVSQLPQSAMDNSVDLPQKPPAGFAREILDALDNAVRLGRLYA